MSRSKSPDVFSLHPLQRALVQAFAATALAIVPVVHAQSVPYGYSETGTPGSTGVSGVDGGTGGTGGTPPGTNQTLPDAYAGSGNTPAIGMTSTGGVGGTGAAGASSSGGGGQGGAGGNLAFSLLGTGASATTAGTAPTVVVTSTGGTGGVPGWQSDNTGTPGKAGDGGVGGSVSALLAATVTSQNGWNGATPGTTAVSLSSIGGDGGAPGNGAQATGSVDAQPGGNGGNSLGASLFIQNGATITSGGTGLSVVSRGGAGSQGESGTGEFGKGAGGKGGVGGNGGGLVLQLGNAVVKAQGAATAATGATVPVDDQGNTAKAAYLAAGVLAQSLGGAGGLGGSGDGMVGKAGAGGAAGQAGAIVLTSDSLQVTTSGFAAAGIVAQAIGGSGGNGAAAGGAFSQKAGNGAAGGSGNLVQVWLGDPAGTGLVQTTGDDSTGVVGQSIGGGGGYGGSVSGGALIGSVTIGGKGETGGNGGVVDVENGHLEGGIFPSDEGGVVIATTGVRSAALVAQSIGGGGGLGGSAQNAVIGPIALDYTVGGTGGTGGNAGVAGTLQVTGFNLGLLSTTGDHSAGMVAQAVGGGGGNGGSATSLTGSAIANVNVTVGGNGGSGGSAGDVVATNAAQILTGGADSWGVLAQSVGGGGGNGGMTKGDAFQVAPDVPTLNVNVTVGGKGGAAADAGNVTATNTGLIATGGAGANGLIAQSIGGGGGNGGDSKAITATAGQGTSFDVTVSVGGDGGSGGAGGTATATNDAGAFILTLGNGARGIFAQSVSGGGGTGGGGANDSAFLLKGNKGGTVNLTLGGSGGNGATGGAASGTNHGNVLTFGDASDAMFVQSVGGGGGLGGAAKAINVGGANAQNVKTGGSSTQSSDGGIVTATNDGTLVTYGADAAGIYAQSVGGGGGKQGTSATTNVAVGTSLGQFLQSGTLPNDTQTYAGGVTGWKPNAWTGYDLSMFSNMAEWYFNGGTSATADDTLPTGVNTVKVQLGSGDVNSQSSVPQGNGGDVTVTNAAGGSIMTSGTMSAGIKAQSVGGGGGETGYVAYDTYRVNTQNPLKPSGGTTGFSVVGGQGYNLGTGGKVTVNQYGSITTQGDVAYGVLAQSIAAGGGLSAMTMNASGTQVLDLTIGGSGVVGGNAGTVDVESSTTGSIATSGNDAIGILGQSIGGGGGTAVVMRPGVDANGNAIVGTDPTADATGQSVQLQVGANPYLPGSGAPTCNGYVVQSCGTGSTVTINANDVSTAGRNAHAIVAQSIGGGGGFVQGLTLAGGNPFAAHASVTGDANTVTIGVTGAVTTTGDGAYGVLAQSIGGGGILAGDLASGNAFYLAFPPESHSENLKYERKGNGGNVGVTVAQGASIATSGANAPAIFAQSIGGGGGLVTTTAGTYAGSLGGTGHAGAILIVNNGSVSATGQGSSAIITDFGGSGAANDVNVTNSGTITGNATAPAIVFAGTGSPNGNGLLDNHGVISNVGGTVLSVSDISLTGPNYAAVYNRAGAQIAGDLGLGVQGWMSNDGTWGMGSYSLIGNVTNNADGTIQVWGDGSGGLGKSVLVGNLNSSGTVGMTIDFTGQNATDLSVDGTATLNGPLKIHATSLSGGGFTVMQTTGGLNLDSGFALVNDGNGAVTYGYYTDGNNLAVYPNTQFGAVARADGYSGTARQVADHLDAAFRAGTSGALSRNLAQLGNVRADQLQAAVSSLGNEAVQAVGTARLSASQAFVERMTSCQDDGAEGKGAVEKNCFWTRALGNHVDRSGGGDSVGYKSDHYGLQAGGQREVGDGWFAGGSLAYETSRIASATTTVNGPAWSGGLMLKRVVGDWIFSGAVDGGAGHYDSTRSLLLGDTGLTAKGSFNAQNVGLHGRVARMFGMGDWYAKPYVDLHATHIRTGDYTEQGAGDLGLNVRAASDTMFAVAPMVEVGKAFSIGDTGVRTYAAIGGAFYSDNAWSSRASFIGANDGAGTFTATSKLPNERAKVKVGASVMTTKSLDVKLEYSGEFASGYQSNTATLKASYLF